MVIDYDALIAQARQEGKGQYADALEHLLAEVETLRAMKKQTQESDFHDATINRSEP